MTASQVSIPDPPRFPNPERIDRKVLRSLAGSAKSAVPAWACDYGLYHFVLTSKTCTVEKIGNPSPYHVDEMGNCDCPHGTAKRRDVCRHQAMIRFTLCYFCCPVCGVYGEPHRRFSFESYYIEGKRCEALICRACAAQRGLAGAVATCSVDWLHSWLTPYEVTVIDAVMCSSSRNAAARHKRFPVLAERS